MLTSRTSFDVIHPCAAIRSEGVNSMTKAHTPGPWATYGEATFAGHKVVDKNKRSVAAFASNGTRPADERNANARLIAAAPELLEAAKEHLAASEYSMSGEDDVAAMLRFGDAEKALRAAIAKAAGGAA